jgi:hypothetical protein
VQGAAAGRDARAGDVERRRGGAAARCGGHHRGPPARRLAAAAGVGQGAPGAGGGGPQGVALEGAPAASHGRRSQHRGAEVGEAACKLPDHAPSAVAVP